MGYIKAVLSRIEDKKEIIEIVETIAEIGNEITGVHRSLASYKGQVNTLKERVDYLEEVLTDAAAQEEIQQEEI